MRDRVRSFLNLERGEELPAFLLFSYLTLVLTAYIITKAARDGIFLAKLSALQLPLVYIGIGVVTGFVVAGYLRLSSRISQTSLISGTLAFFIFNLVALWFAVRAQWSPAPWVFYIWTSIFGIILTTQVWTVGNNVLDLRQAKRLFPLISCGGILGGSLGGLIGAKLVKRVGTDNLMLLLIPLLVVCVVVVQILLRRFSFPARATSAGKGAAEAKKGFTSAFGTIRKSPYLTLIVALLALSAIVTLTVGFQFMVVVQKAFRGKDQITGFCASFYAYLSFFSFLLQVLAGSRIVEKFGVRVTVLILPLALVGGTAVLIGFPLALWAAGVLKGSDYVVRYSIDRATTELLYVPVPQSIKADVKAVIDMIMQRLADGVGGLLLLLVLFVTSHLYLSQQRGVSVFNLLLLAGWLWVAFRTRKEYVATIHKNLTDRPELPKSTIDMLFGDKASVLTLRTMLASKDEEVVLYAVDVFAARGRADLLPPGLTTHPSPRVRLKAMEVVALTEQQILERVHAESNSSVRAGAIIRACKIVQPQQPMMALSQFLASSDLRVRLASLLCLVRQAREGEKEAVKQFLDHIADELDAASKEWKDVAEALGEIPYPAAVDLHLRLLQHPDAAVKKQAILSAGRAGHRELVPFLVPLLADRQWAADARLALREYGARILGTLADFVKDPTEDIEVRRNIPLVLAYIPQQEAVDLLLDSLFDYDGLVRYRAIRALGKLRALDPELRFDSAKVRLRIQEECETTLWFQQALASLYPKDGNSDLLLQLLKDKVSRSRERVFRLLALLLPASAACASFLAMLEEDRLRKASAAELLDNVLPKGLKQWVLPLLEPKAVGGRHRLSVPTILEACLKNPDPILQECTADAVAKRRWPEFPARF
jgi:AAA family ATP:ADP antiporter